MSREIKVSPGEEPVDVAPEDMSPTVPGEGGFDPAAAEQNPEEVSTEPPDGFLSGATPEQGGGMQREDGEEEEKESLRSGMRRVLLDACLLGMGMLLIVIVVGAGSAGGLALLAGGAMEVMVFAVGVGVLIGVTVAMIVQVLFMGGMARPVRLCSLLLVVWGLTLIPLCCVGVSSVMDPQYSGELNRFVFTRSETTASIVGVLMLLELLAWFVLVVRVARRCLRTRQA